MEKLHITLKEDQNIFFTSDLHLGHGNILKFCNRPFESIKEMNTVLIDNWNNTVKENDIIFCLGDFDWFPSRHAMLKTLSRLNGEIYMVMGNHDKADTFSLCSDLEKFHLCSDVVHLFLSDSREISRLPQKTIEIVLSHYPLLTWSHVNHSIQLFGHIHSKEPKSGLEFGKDLRLRANQIDIGVDANRYYPISIDVILNVIGNETLSKVFKTQSKENMRSEEETSGGFSNSWINTILTKIFHKKP